MSAMIGQPTDPCATAATLRAAYERVLASGARQERLIEALLTLALSQRGLERQQPFDLAAATNEVLLARQPQVQRLGLKPTPGSAGATPGHGQPPRDAVLPPSKPP